MRLDADRLFAERWPRPEVEHTAVWPTGCLHTNGVDALRRQQLPGIRRRDIDRGKAEPSPACSTRDYPAAKRIRPAQRIRGALEIAASDRATNGGRGNRAPIADGYRRDHLDAKAVSCSERLQHFDITLAIPPEAMVVPHEEVLHAET